MYLEFYSCITTNLYFKVFVAIIFGLALTFVQEIDALHSKQATILILMILLLMTFTHLDEFGAVLLLTALFAIILNIQATKASQQQTTTDI